MLLIECPWCGERAQTEFIYGGDGTLKPPADADALGAWVDYVYVRDNPRGPHVELWNHASGCRRWFKVLRDTVSDEIHATSPAGEAMEGDA